MLLLLSRALLGPGNSTSFAKSEKTKKFALDRIDGIVREGANQWLSAELDTKIFLRWWASKKFARPCFIINLFL